MSTSRGSSVSAPASSISRSSSGNGVGPYYPGGGNTGRPAWMMPPNANVHTGFTSSEASTSRSVSGGGGGQYAGYRPHTGFTTSEESSRAATPMVTSSAALFANARRNSTSLSVLNNVAVEHPPAIAPVASSVVDIAQSQPPQLPSSNAWDLVVARSAKPISQPQKAETVPRRKVAVASTTGTHTANPVGEPSLAPAQHTLSGATSSSSWWLAAGGNNSSLSQLQQRNFGTVTLPPSTLIDLQSRLDCLTDTQLQVRSQELEKELSRTQHEIARRRPPSPSPPAVAAEERKSLPSSSVSASPPTLLPSAPPQPQHQHPSSREQLDEHPGRQHPQQRYDDGSRGYGAPHYPNVHTQDQQLRDPQQPTEAYDTSAGYDHLQHPHNRYNYNENIHTHHHPHHEMDTSDPHQVRTPRNGGGGGATFGHRTTNYHTNDGSYRHVDTPEGSPAATRLRHYAHNLIEMVHTPSKASMIVGAGGGASSLSPLLRSPVHHSSSSNTINNINLYDRVTMATTAASEGAYNVYGNRHLPSASATNMFQSSTVPPQQQKHYRSGGGAAAADASAPSVNGGDIGKYTHHHNHRHQQQQPYRFGEQQPTRRYENEGNHYHPEQRYPALQQQQHASALQQPHQHQHLHPTHGVWDELAALRRIREG